jgi:hypothetical protein
MLIRTRAITDVETDYGLCAHHNPQGFQYDDPDFTTFRAARRRVTSIISNIMQRNSASIGAPA